MSKKNSKKTTVRKKIFNHLGNVAFAAVSFALMTPPASAIDTENIASQVIGSEGGHQATKEIINATLKLARTKPMMTTATSIVCLACIPATGAAASPGLCIACGILLVKTIG